MREVLSKIIKVALAFALVFMVAAPLIVGVYDAANTGTDSRTVATGGIVYVSGTTDGVRNQATDEGLSGNVSGGNAQGQAFDGSSEGTSDGVYSAIPDRESSELSGDSSRQVQGNDEQGYTENEQASDSELLADWYSGDSVAGDLLRSGSAHLVYTFSDGSTVDFGNPYVLDWSDVAMPNDFDLVVSGDDGQFVPFAPEKAYAGPVGTVVSKLKYLAIKSGYWKSLNSMMYSLFISAAMTLGVNYTAATTMANTFMQRMPAISRAITSETVAFTEEDTAMLVSEAISRVAARKVAMSEIPAAVDAEIAAEITAVETTGQLLGGGSGNFINALYQLAATGGIPASILNSDIALYIGSWLGGQFENFSDLAAGEVTDTSGVLTAGDDVRYFKFKSSAAMLDGYSVQAGAYSGYVPILRYDNINGIYSSYAVASIDSVSSATLTLRGSGNSVAIEIKTDGTQIAYFGLVDASSWKTSIKSSPYDTFTHVSDFRESGTYYLNPDVSWTIVYQGQTSGSFVNGQYEGSLDWQGSSAAQFQPFDGEIVGQDAAYDSAGNITDYGNVSVSDVTNPAYVAPNTYADALAAMQAAASQNVATADSPAYGQTDTTIGDWVNENQTPAPEPGSEESSQDDFKVEDLEKVFPFCIPWDIYYLLAALNADPTAPSFTWQFDFGPVGTYGFNVDLSPYETVAAVVRVCEALAFCVGLALITRDLIRG